MSDYIKLTKEELLNVVIYYYNDNDKIYYINDKEEYGNLETSLLLKKYHSFQLLKGYSKDNDGLLKFKQDFNKWRMNILATTKDIDYKQFYNHNHAVKSIFNLMCMSNMKKNKFTDITFNEYKYFEKCFNSGLTYFNKEYKDIEIECDGYDFKRYYPTILNSDILIPTKEGIEKKLNELPDILEYGIYKVKISCDHSDFKKIFSFSEYHHYTHFNLDFAIKNKNKYNITIELIKDEEFNALIYQKKNLINSKSIFNRWFERLDYLKTKFPDNKLVKHIFSSCWGELSKFNKVYKTKEQIEEENIIFLDEYDFLNGIEDNKATHLFFDHEIFNNKEIFVLIPLNEKPYKFNLRIKPFLTGYGRIITSSIMEKDLNSVIRTHTDGVCFTKPQNFNNLNWYPVIEDKTSGKIIWYSTNSNNRNFEK